MYQTDAARKKREAEELARRRRMNSTYPATSAPVDTYVPIVDDNPPSTPCSTSSDFSGGGGSFDGGGASGDY